MQRRPLPSGRAYGNYKAIGNRAIILYGVRTESPFDSDFIISTLGPIIIHPTDRRFDEETEWKNTPTRNGASDTRASLTVIVLRAKMENFHLRLKISLFQLQ